MFDGVFARKNDKVHRTLSFFLCLSCCAPSTWMRFRPDVPDSRSGPPFAIPALHVGYTF